MATRETVLIIDNRRDNIELLADNVLRPNGYGVSVAYDGEEGLAKALGERPDLIIMDVNIPRISGLDVLQRLREAGSKIPVILMTFHGSEQAAVQAFRLGARDYIIKPYDARDILDSVSRAMAEQRLRRERNELTEAIAYAHRHGEQRLKELSILSSIGKSVTALLDQDRLLTRIVEAAVYITGAEEGFLLMVDPESGELYMRAARGLGEKYARGFRLKVSDSIAGEVVRTGKPVVITGSKQGDLLKLKTGYLVKSLLHVPLKIGEKVIGVLSVDHMQEDHEFSNHDLYLLSTLADYAAIALDNARLRVGRAQNIVTGELDPNTVPPLPLEAAPPSRIGEALAGHQVAIEERLRAGGSLLSGLHEQVQSLEVWMEGIAEQERDLTAVGTQAGTAATEPAPAEAPSTGATSTEPPPTVSGYEMDAILDAMEEGILLVDTNDQVVLANRTAEALLGRRLVDRPIADACDDPRWLKTYQIVRAASQLRGDTPGSELTGAMTRLAVSQRMLRAAFRLDLRPRKSEMGTVIILTDVTAEREAERTKESFASAISQELRTPITSIMGYTDLLMGESVGALEDAQRRFLSRVRANAEKIGGQLNSLLAMSNVDNRQLQVRAEAMDLAPAIDEAVGAVRDRIIDREQMLDVSVERDLPPVDADPDAMYHILTNLLQNAHHCSPDGAHIIFRASRVQYDGESYVSVAVTDNGGGLASEDIKRVFNRYYRSDSAHVPGLGDPDIMLPVVKVLVEAHGGRIWMESESGVGTTFTALFPQRGGGQA